jgi:hypothetical protein
MPPAEAPLATTSTKDRLRGALEGGAEIEGRRGRSGADGCEAATTWFFGEYDRMIVCRSNRAGYLFRLSSFCKPTNALQRPAQHFRGPPTPGADDPASAGSKRGGSASCASFAGEEDPPPARAETTFAMPMKSPNTAGGVNLLGGRGPFHPLILTG